MKHVLVIGYGQQILQLQCNIDILFGELMIAGSYYFNTNLDALIKNHVVILRLTVVRFFGRYMT